MPVAAPVTRAVFPLMNMSHLLEHGVSSNDKTLGGQTLKVVEVNLLLLIALHHLKLTPTCFNHDT
jgi:hypothetical protein